MKKRIRLIIIAIVLVVLSGVYSVIDKNNSVYDTSIDNSEFVSWELGQGDSVIQSFVSSEDALDGVSMKMSATGNIQDITAEFKLLDDKENVLVQKEISLEELESGKFFKVDFERQNQCKGKKYTAYIEVTHCDEMSKMVVYSTQGIMDNTEFLFTEESNENTMVLRTITRRFDVETFIVTLCFVLYVVFFMRWLTKLFK